MSDWPLVERPLADHLNDSTSFDWTIEGGHVGDRVPLGIVQQVGGSGDLDLEESPSIEVTLIAATRSGVWEMAQQVNRVFAGLNPGGIAGRIHVDEARQAFGFVIDPDRGTAAYRVATATYTLTLRPQDETTTQP